MQQQRSLAKVRVLFVRECCLLFGAKPFRDTFLMQWPVEIGIVPYHWSDHNRALDVFSRRPQRFFVPATQPALAR